MVTSRGGSSSSSSFGISSSCCKIFPVKPSSPSSFTILRLFVLLIVFIFIFNFYSRSILEDEENLNLRLPDSVSQQQVSFSFFALVNIKISQLRLQYTLKNCLYVFFCVSSCLVKNFGKPLLVMAYIRVYILHLDIKVSLFIGLHLITSDVVSLPKINYL